MPTITDLYSPTLFKGKHILVTGGRSGIGYAISEAYLKLGAKVWIASRKEEPLRAAAAQLAKLGECRYSVLNIKKLDEVEALANEIADEWGRLDILVNNAGGQFPSPAEDIAAKGWDAVINNNLNGTWYMTQTFAKQFFIPQQQGNIVNIIVMIYRGFPGMAHSAAARAGIDNFTKSLAVEWAPYNIRINAVAPGVIATSGLDQYPEALVEAAKGAIPFRRMGTPDEVAHTVLFFSSPLASYTSGETLYVDGAMHLWGSMWQVPK